MTGHITLVSGPSGSGKSTLITRFIAEHPQYRFPTSVTTRPPRPGEVQGVHYDFVDDAEFERRRAAGAFLEWAHVYGLYYGTLKSTVLDGIASGCLFLKDVDVQGAESLMGILPASAVTSIFVAPPSFAVLEQRLRGRQSDQEGVVQKRIEEARREISRMDFFDHVITNHAVEQTYAEFSRIILARPGAGKS